VARINFRQGIVRHGKTPNQPFFLQQNGNDVDLLISPELTTIAFEDGDKDYLFTESTSISNAWLNLSIPSQDYWLYWELDRITGVRTFGTTTFEPIYSPTAPVTPAVNQMWFDTSIGNISSSRMHYWNGSVWIHVLRVIASKVNNFQFFSPIDGFSVESNYIGTQIGITGNVISNVGSLAYDKNGKPIVNQDGRFFTTEDVFTTGVPDGASIKVNNTLTRARATEPLGAYQVVVFDDFEKVSLATTFFTIDKIYGLVDVPAIINQTVNIITKGSIFNEAWDFSSTGATPPMEGSINSPIYITPLGELTTDTGFAMPGQIPVGAIIGKQTILFSPGIYGTINVPPTTSHSGLANLNADDHLQYHNDARGDMRYYEQTVADSVFAPIIHTHTKTDITDFAHTHLEADITNLDKYTQAEVDTFVNNLDAIKVNISGSTMTGPLILPADPTTSLQAATKQYVDALASGIDAKESVVVSTTADIGGTYTSIGGTSGSGSFIGVNITALDGTYLTDYDFTTNNRVLVKDQTDPKQNGIYIVTNFTTPISSDLERAPDHDGSPIFEVSPGNFVFVTDGISLAGSGWTILGGTATGPNGTIVLNTDNINWGQVAASTLYEPGTNISIDASNNISVIDALSGGTVDALKWNNNTLTLTLPATGQPIIYNATTPTFENASFSLPSNVGLGDQVLVTDGLGSTSWTNPQVTNPMTSSLDVAGFSLNNSLGTFVLPTDNGTNGFILSTDGAGLTSWISPPAGGNQTPWTSNIDAAGFSLITLDTVEADANAITLNPGDSTGGGINTAGGGDINLLAGNNTYSSGSGGAINITGGSQQYDLSGNGGDVNITAGNTSHTGFSQPGSVLIKGGDTAAAQGGAVSLFGGDSTSAFGHTGQIFISTLNSTAGYAGNISILSGNTGYDDGTGGSVNIDSGNGYYGGKITLSHGAGSGGTGSYYQGAVIISSKNSTSGLLRISSGGTYHAEINVPVTLGSYTNFTLPPNNGTVGQVLTTDGTGITTWTSSSGLQNIVEDLTPQLGGDLDVGLFSIKGPDGNTVPGGILNLHGGDGLIDQPGGAVNITGGTGQGIAFAGSVNITGGACTGSAYGGDVLLRPGDSATGTDGRIRIEGPTLTSEGEIRLVRRQNSLFVGLSTPPTLSASVIYKLPTSDGSSGDVLQTDGSANLSFVTPSAPASKPSYEKIAVTASPPSDVVNTTVSIIATTGSPLQASLQVFRNGMLQEEDLDGAIPIVGDFIVSGANQLTFAPGTLLNGDTIIIYVFN